MTIRLEVRCEDASHRINILPDGEMELLDHPDLEADLAAAALGFPTCRCFHFYRAWEKYPLMVLVPYSFEALGREDAWERWGHILIAWLDPWVPVVIDELSEVGPEVEGYKIVFKKFVETIRTLADEGVEEGYWSDLEKRKNIDRYLSPGPESLMDFAGAAERIGARITKQVIYAFEEALRYFMKVLDRPDPKELEEAVKMVQVFCGLATKKLVFDETVAEFRAINSGAELSKAQRAEVIRVSKQAGAQENLECLQTAIKMLDVSDKVVEV